MNYSDELLKVLEIEDDADFKVKVLLMIGELVLMNHWLRGILYYLDFHRIIHVPDGEQRDNFHRLLKNIEDYEERVWQHAPPRAMMIHLQEYLNSGVDIGNLITLAESDSHGRVPYNSKNYDDIADILRRISEIRKLHG